MQIYFGLFFINLFLSLSEPSYVVTIPRSYEAETTEKNTVFEQVSLMEEGKRLSSYIFNTKLYVPGRSRTVFTFPNVTFEMDEIVPTVVLACRVHGRKKCC